ncbi:hypothetical protein JADG_006627 [Aureobasidium aubasidani]|nr:hypothetical protein JADG_006627 [Aureobasidium pullulans]
MFFTSAQLSADPELRPITWSSPQAYQSERHYLYTQLAEALHISASSSATNSATTSTSDISNASSNLSPKSSKSDLASIKKRDSIISCSAETITTLASKKSASSLLNACSRKLVSPFLASSSSSSTQVKKFKPVTFNSPQTSVFRFDTAGPTAASTSTSAASASATPTASATCTSNATSTTATTPIKPSPKKVDSVMGSPIKFLSPSLFKRNNKIISSGAAGKIIKSCAIVKETDIFNYFKGLGGKKDGEDCGVSKKDIIHEPKDEDITTYKSEETSENSKSGKKAEEAADANHTDNAKPAKTPLPINPDINEKGILYIEYLGLAVVAASPKPMEEQYLFVKQQIQKSRDMGFRGSWS